MFGKIAGFEFRYQLTHPVFWVAFIIFGLLTFGIVASDNVSLGGASTIHENGPYTLILSAGVFSLFFMFISTAFVANVIVRDEDTGFGPIIKATRITKFDYLFGRFTGAVAAACLAFISVPLGIFIGSFMPWLDPETLGTNDIRNYLYAYFVFGVPNVILTSAVFFAIATVTRSMMGSYVALIVFLIGYFVVTGVLGNKPEFEQALAYLEPLGSGAYGFVTEYYTTVERNTRLPAIEGPILWNRVLAFVLAAAFLALAYALFRFGSKPAKATKKQKLSAMADTAPATSRTRGPLPKPSYGPRTAVAQLVKRTRFEVAQVLRSPAYFILVAVGLMMAMVQVFFSGEVYGTKTVLLTRVVLDAIAGNIGLIGIIVAIYYAGELVWRERDRKVAEIVDSSSAPDWVFTIPKTIASALVLLSTLLAAVVAGLIAQTVTGHTDYEFDKYLTWYLLPQAVDFLLIAILAVFVQTLVPHKFWGWGIMLLWIISRVVMNNLGLEHNLYDYGNGPEVPTSDINGLGDYWIGRMWFRVYWTALAVILAVLSYALLRRGAETRLSPRLKRLPGRLRGVPGVIAAAALLVFIGSGAWIYVNTNVWNEYRTSKDEERWLANYEKTLLDYEAVKQPTITAVKLNLDLFPRAPRLVTTGTYEIENQTGAPISELHLRLPDRDMEKVLTVPGARLKKSFDEYNYFIYAFDRPMLPGEKRTVGFKTTVEQRGFRNSGNITRIVDNGTFISNAEISPLIGMDRSFLLQDPVVRRRHGLDPATIRLPKLNAAGAEQYNYLRRDSGFVRADITVTTDADQIPIAPGRKVSQTVNGNRKTAHFVSDAPIMHFFSVQSARYAVKSTNHKGVEIAVYYHPEHDWNVDRMLRSGQLSLDYFQANFSPYQFRQLRFIEFPYGSFAQAFANTVPWSENLGFTADLRDPEKIDYVTYVGAHEVAHQWWAHQIIGSNQQGMTVLSETLAQYSALMVMEKLYGPDQIRKFLKYELDSYLRNRGTDLIGEQPLGRNENQQHIHYRKGSLVMYLLKDMMGEAKVNAALREVLARFAFRNAPYPTSQDLVLALRRQAGDDAEAQQLITDLFEKITLYDLKAKGATVRRRSDGRFDVALSLEARKLYADDKGNETAAPLDEHFDIGLFTAEPGKKGFDSKDVILLRRMPLKSGVETLNFTVDRAPAWIGVDPYNKRIDRNSDDNLFKVTGAPLNAH